MSQLFASGGQSIAVSASASFIGRTDVGGQVKVLSGILFVQASAPWYSSHQEKEGKVTQSLDIWA